MGAILPRIRGFISPTWGPVAQLGILTPENGGLSRPTGKLDGGFLGGLGGHFLLGVAHNLNQEGDG